MAGFGLEYWCVLAVIALGAVLGMLGRMSAAIEQGKNRHELDLSAERLRRHYASQLAAQHPRSHEVVEVDIIEDEATAA